MSECERKKKRSGRATDLARGERGLGMPLSATRPYIAWQEDPTNSDTAASAAAEARLLSRSEKEEPKERVCGAKRRSNQKGKEESSGRKQRERENKQQASAQSVEHETAGMPQR